MAASESNGLIYGLIGCGLVGGLVVTGLAVLVVIGAAGAAFYLTAPVAPPPPLPVEEPAPATEAAAVDDAEPASPKPRTATPPAEPAAPAPEAEAAAPVEPAAEGPKPVSVDGPARVTLTSAGGSYRLPAVVPEGRYTILAAFEGEQPVEVGNARIGAQGGEVIACNPNMGICRVR